MDGYTRKRAATTISRAWRNRPYKRSWRLSRAAKWTSSRSFKGEYSFTRTVSTNAQGLNFAIATDAVGVVKFFVGANNADNFQIDFSLQQIILRLGGVAQITAQVPNYTEFTGLFDQWCIDKVDVMLVPTYTNSNLSAAVVTAQLPTIVHCIDDDDSAAATKTDIQQYANCKYTQLLTGFTDPKPIRSFRPKPAIAVFQQGATFAYGSVTPGPKWIDVAYPTVPHYSVKGALDNANVASSQPNTTMAYVDVVCKLHLKFKTVR